MAKRPGEEQQGMFLTTVVVEAAFPNIKGPLSTGFDNICASGDTLSGEGPEGKSY